MRDKSQRTEGWTDKELHGAYISVTYFDGAYESDEQRVAAEKYMVKWRQRAEREHRERMERIRRENEVAQ